MKLVIVESPSKCKRIESYLGEDYKVIATCGHFRKVNSLEQIDFSTFKIKYENTNKRVIKRLREETAIASEVILATDDDREGEIIAWHICQVCKLPLSTKRIIFREITKGEILKAVNSPITIKMNRVYSQTTRQILDIYIGFKISPLLWKYVKHTLSAGRCQTPALHLIAEREKEIEKQGYETNYKISGFFTNKDIEFQLERHLEEDEVIPFLQSINNHTFVLSRHSKETTEQPPPILNTCLLQQLPVSMSPQRIMKAAQNLYENGLITYLRTDSSSYSDDFLKDVSKYLGDNYCRPNMNSNDKNSNEKDSKSQAHEGIRVTQLNIDIICLDTDSNKLYSYLHKYTLQTCMKPAILLNKIYTTECPNTLKFTYTAISYIFNGWKEETKRVDWSLYLDCLNLLNYKTINACEVFKSQQFHLSSTQLISQLEKRNIGRPSTYTNILDSIEKNYVTNGKITGKEYSLKQYKLQVHNDIETSVVHKKIEETNKLMITDSGKEVDAFCYKHFEPIFNYDYTNQMELSLDQIENGSKEWKTVLRGYIDHVNSLLQVDLDSVKKVYTTLHAGYYNKCPVIIKDGIHGFYAEYKDKSVSLSQYSEKEKIYSWIVDQSIPQESFQTLVDFILKDKVVMHITDSWSVRVGPRGNYLYFKAKNMKQPKFYTCPEGLNRDEMEQHIRNKYKTI
jgi:DNA topoisomerase-1